MDTRSKRFSNNILLRTVVFLLCACAITVFVLAFVLAAIEDSTVYRVYEFLWNNELIDADTAGSFNTGRIVSNIWYSWMPILIPSGFIGIMSLIWLMITTGGKKYKGNDLSDNPRKEYVFDHIWTEVQVAFAGCAAGISIPLIDTWFAYFNNNPIRPVLSDFTKKVLVHNYGPAKRVEMFEELEIAERLVNLGNNGGSVFKIIGDAVKDFEIEVPLMAGPFLLVVGIALWFGLSIIRLIKSRRFFKNALIVQFCMLVGGGIGSAVMNVANGGSLMRKIVLIMCGIALLSATIVGAPIMIVLVIIFAPKWVKRFEAIQHGVDEVKSGNLEYKIPIREDGKDDELTRLARGINEISQASNEAVKNELKNQRMKTELISNVSHDLKTPLTSLVTYIDLLKSEGLDSPNAPEYLAVLDAKTNRLSKLTEDLFEAAKASSGAMPVNMGRVDAHALVRQVMGEMDDRIEASGLEFILKPDAAKFMVEADGQLLYRVVDNLINNVLKYALPGSRVYIDISERDSFVILDFKNISAQALNIDPDELMERFKRGDESRATEGSGLGLAIAKDLTKLMGGFLELTIDGDFFKASVCLNKSPEATAKDICTTEV